MNTLPRTLLVSLGHALSAVSQSSIDDKCVKCDRWFHGQVSRKDTEKMLASPGNCRGMFLVRESESIAGN